MLSKTCIFLILGSLLPFTLAIPPPYQPFKARTSPCFFTSKRAAVAQEIKTIHSYSALDAAQIPLAPLASRTFFITPSELGGAVTLPPVNVGVTACRFGRGTGCRGESMDP
ncbi:MAG: hypothetical protein Q9219_007588 [cf. Caloplaca sp. 3 TL-2023]